LPFWPTGPFQTKAFNGDVSDVTNNAFLMIPVL
jgi:hypothetical protein